MLSLKMYTCILFNLIFNLMFALFKGIVVLFCFYANEKLHIHEQNCDVILGRNINVAAISAQKDVGIFDILLS